MFPAYFRLIPLIFLLEVAFSSDKVNIAYTNYNFDNPNQCTVIQTDPNKPNPSLVQCYRNNPNACCNSIADEYIKDQYSNFLSASCYRKFPEMETYFCYGCNPAEFVSTIRSNRTIFICSDLATRIWGGDLSQNTTKFDACGMRSFWNDITTSQDVFLPSYAWENVNEFFNDVKPPLFENYTVIVADVENCYNSAWKLKGFLFNSAFLALFAAFWLLF